MRLVDANVLLYAVDADAEHHVAARTWLDTSLGGADTVGLSWIVLLAFLRIATKIGLYPNPLPVHDALAQIGDWTNAPGARIVQPTSGHYRVLSGLLEQVGAGGNLVNDAHLAAMAIEHRANIVSYDSDFGRFVGVRWERPDDVTT